jgi:hypothetical protein
VSSKGLRTKDEAKAKILLNAKNESLRQPILNLQIAKAYLIGSDRLDDAHQFHRHGQPVHLQRPAHPNKLHPLLPHRGNTLSLT